MAKAAKTDGLTFVTAPALDLFTCPGSASSCLPCPPGVPKGITCQADPSGTPNWQAYLDYHMAALEASNASVIDIQAQSLQDTPNWDHFVRTAIQQAKAANPSVKVLVGLTNNPKDLPSTCAASLSLLESDLSYALQHGASGAWINEDQGDNTNLMDQVVYSFIG
jgi:hypothetical protein